MPRRRHRQKGSNAGGSSSKLQLEGNSALRVKQSEILGRYLVAAQDLPEGTVVISEAALVVGPAQDSPPSCLGCCNPIPHTARCGKCQWPLCSVRCRGLNRRLGHSRQECEQLATCPMTSPRLPESQLYNAVVPLRCLLLKNHEPAAWSRLASMEAHNAARRAMPALWEYNQKSVVDRIRNEWNITQYSEEEIHTVCGILEVNAFAVGDEALNMRGLYPTAFLIAHDCVPNTAHTDNGEGEYLLTVYTSVTVTKDQPITLSYTNSLQGTLKRREHLRQSKFFECQCARCRDPTELGTYLSAVRCTHCERGHVMPLSATSWLCDNSSCEASPDIPALHTALHRIEVEIKALDHNSVEALESSIRRYSSVLHKNHYLLLGMKFTLSQLYGKTADFLIHQMTEAVLERKKDICEEVLKVFDVLEPGLTKTRGLTMYELHAPIMILTIKKFEMRKIAKGDLCRRLRKVSFYLRESSRILKFETGTSEEGSVRVAAEDALAQLRSWEPVVGKL